MCASRDAYPDRPAFYDTYPGDHLQPHPECHLDPTPDSEPRSFRLADHYPISFAHGSAISIGHTNGVPDGHYTAAHAFTLSESFSLADAFARGFLVPVAHQHRGDHLLGWRAV